MLFDHNIYRWERVQSTYDNETYFPVVYIIATEQLVDLVNRSPASFSLCRLKQTYTDYDNIQFSCVLNYEERKHPSDVDYFKVTVFAPWVGYPCQGIEGMLEIVNLEDIKETNEETDNEIVRKHGIWRYLTRLYMTIIKKFTKKNDIPLLDLSNRDTLI